MRRLRNLSRRKGGNGGDFNKNEDRGTNKQNEPCETCKLIATERIFSHNSVLVKSGCPVCTMIRQAASQYSSSAIVVNKQAKRIEYEAGSLDGKQRLLFEFFIPSHQAQPTNSEMDKSWASFLSTVTARKIHHRPDDAGCYWLIKSWLQLCVSVHQRCTQSEYKEPPKRLLEIVDDTVYLRETVNLSQSKPRYTALSYCWGSGTTLQTTTATIRKHQAGISVGDLPATLRDAVLVSKRLGVDFLWIDALCILQDSHQDWEAECSRMGDYYRHSYLTISPLEATAADSGFLQPRPSLLACQTLLAGKLVGLRQPIHDAVKGSPLSKRGWTLQERLLATRILHYGKNEMLWECLTCTAREGSTVVSHDEEDSSDLVTSEGQDFKRCLTTLAEDPYCMKTGAFAVWYRMVRLYSERLLTFHSDKLPAISAIAKVISEKCKSENIAGIFLDDLSGLAWSHGEDSEVDELVLASTLVAPTWSWANVHGTVKYPFYHQTRNTDVNNAHYITYDPHVGLGCMQVRALSKPVISFGCVVMNSINLHSYANFNNIGGSAKSLGVLDLRGLGLGNPEYDLSWDGVYTLDEIEPVIAIGICERTYRSSEHIVAGNKLCSCFGCVEEIYSYVLFLHSHDILDDCWRRIGLGVIVSAPSCTDLKCRIGFEGTEWATLNLV